MPMPWKKSKGGRISRLVADFQQSPKHGGSLVVETGFPTSLIDLFVKNRARLKKSSKRRHLDPSPPSPPSPPPQQPTLMRHAPPEQREALIISPASEDSVAGAGDDVGTGPRQRSCGGARVFLAMVKVFMVVVLALSTKTLAVGVTLSAFVLLFTEFVAARVVDAPPIFLDLLINKFSRKEQESSIETLEDHYREIASSLEEDPKNPPEKIPIQESISLPPRPKSVAIPDKNRDFLDTEIVIPRAAEGEELVPKIKKTRSAKLKSKIVKNMVPKKFRKKKSKKMEESKDQSESASEASSIVSDDRFGKSEDEEDWQFPASEFRIVEEEEEDEKSHVGVGGSEKSFKIESSGCGCRLIILLLTALCGLVFGKVSAIVLTLLWCLMLRVYRKNERKSIFSVSSEK